MQAGIESLMVHVQVAYCHTSLGTQIGAKHLVFVSSRSVKLRELSFAQFVDFLGESLFIFQFLNAKIYSYVLFDVIVNFIIQKLKIKHTFLKNYTN